MILVDSSVWIAHLRGHRTQATAKLEAWRKEGDPDFAADLGETVNNRKPWNSPAWD